MNKIVSPLQIRMQGPSVADLQDGLQLLMDRGLLLRRNEGERLQLAAALKPERSKNTYAGATSRLVAIFQSEQGLPASGNVDERTASVLNALIERALAGKPAPAPAPGPAPPASPPPSHPIDKPAPDGAPEFQYLVRGQVLYRSGLPIPKLIVRAFHPELRQDIPLGEGPTDEDGKFEIYYNPSPAASAAGVASDRPPDLFVRVYERADSKVGAEKLLVESPTRFAVQRVVKFRLLVDGGAGKTWSEYDQMRKEMAPYLGKLRIEDLVEDDQHRDVSLLAGKLAQDPARIAAFVAAHKLAAEVKGEPEVFYGLLRKGLPSNLSRMLAVAPETRSRALVAAIREGIAPGKLVGNVRKVREQFDRYAITHSSAQKQVAGGVNLGAVLAVGIGDAGKVGALVEKLLARGGSTQKLWQDIAADPELAPVAHDAQITLQLAALTGRHLPLMKAILAPHRDRPLTMRQLARLDRKDWVELIESLPAGERVPANMPGKNLAEKTAVYAATLRRIVTDTMPTEVFAHRVQVDAAQPEDVKVFWRNVESGVAGFELGRGRIRPYLAEHPQLLQGVANPEKVFAHLDESQRLFNLTRDYGEQQVLRSEDLSSSLAIARLGQGSFIQRVTGAGLPQERAMIIYESAARVSAAALDLMIQLNPAFNIALPRALNGPSVKQVPDLKTLFGSFNLCACSECRSVHSAAAYVADLWAWLSDRKSDTAGVSARDVLFERRPDLGEIELTCANTNTVLPYTDLVNECLEQRIAPFAGFALPAATEADLDAKTLSNAIRDAFEARDIELAPTARVIVAVPGDRWSITDGSMLYSVVKNAGALEVTGAWPQTGASAASLAAVPEHVNPKAYEVLRAQVYPWILPLQLPTEETRVFLAHLGCPRNELMAEMLPGGAAAALGNVAVAAEYLGIGDAERQYATNNVQAPNPAYQPWEYWGLAEHANVVNVYDAAAKAFADKPLDWLDALGWVSQLLRRASLEYETLVRILGCRSINPGLNVRIVSADPEEPATCDVAKLTLTNLTPAVADRLTRFVRVWRKLGCEPEDLNVVLTSLCGGNLNDDALLKISHVRRLLAAFGRETQELVALWAPIPIDGANSLHQRLFLNPNVLAPVDSAFALDAAGELAVVAADPPEALISRHTPPILAALRISAADLAALQAAGIANDDALTLANLSDLYRHALLAQCLELSIPDLLLLISMSGIDPFDVAATADTVRFVDLVARVGESGLSIPDLAYLLFQVSPETSALAPPIGATAELAAEVRRRLRVIRDDTSPRPDPAGVALRRELAGLRWPADMIDGAVAVLAGTARFVTPLNAPPAGFAIPPDFAARLTHDADAQTLALTGSLTIAERNTLQAAFADAAYQNAIADLHLQPVAWVAKRMRAFQWPPVSVPLAALPAGLEFPPALRSRVAYDPGAKKLSFDGTMNAADKAALDSLSNDAAYRAAVAALLVAADAFVPAADNQFITAPTAAALFEVELPADRLASVLARTLQRRRVNESTSLAVRMLADAVGMKYRLAERLLTRDLPHPALAGRNGIDVYLDEAFIASSPDVAPDEATFPHVFEITLRLMKIAALASGMGLSERAIGWLGDFATTVAARSVSWGGGAIQAKWLALNELPAKAQPIDPARFAAWLRLFELGRSGAGIQGGAATVEEMLKAARAAGATANSVAQRFATLTGSDSAEIVALAAAIGLALPNDLLDEVGIGRLRDAGRRLQRLQTSTAQAAAWAAPEPAAAAGIAARRAVQASYAADQWPDAIRPLEEKLREKRRAALVAYLVVRPDLARGETWIDENGMYSHLLIDVLTHPVVLTSRLKQAIGSTQLFVQRCLMNLENRVVADETQDIGWRQWPWMKQFRVWEANRKVFLYPENWIEPELRDDKSPFFLELESTLLQSDVTAESAEAAYRGYLARLDEVARLEVAGTFLQPGEGGAPDEYHVFARTPSDPPSYFQRKWVGQARWTPWVRVDLDVPAGQILPLMWNRRLYVFWPIFTRKARKPPAGDTPVEGAPYFEIQLAWSEWRQGRWGPKKTTPLEVTLDSVIQPDLALRDEGRGKHVFRATTSGAELLVWYESADSKPELNKYGQIVRPGSVIPTDGWRFSGCNGRVTNFKPFNIGVLSPPNTHAVGMAHVENDWTDGTLQLPKGINGTEPSVVFRRTPGSERFRLLGPHQEPHLTGQMPFFYHDDAETLFVVPREAWEWITVWKEPERIDPRIVDIIDHIYYEPRPFPDPIGPIEKRWDPVPVTRYVYEEVAKIAQAAPIAEVRNVVAAAERADVMPEVAAASAKSLALTRTLLPLASSGLPVAGGLAKPLIGAMPMANLSLAFNERRLQVQESKATKKRAFFSPGDARLITISEYLDRDRLFVPGDVSVYRVLARRYEFQSHYHPYVCPMVRELNLAGIDGLLRRPTQLLNASTFESRYGPTQLVEMGDAAKKDKYPVEDVDFDFDGAYAGYNWELFFHVPLLIACKLAQNQHFEAAQKWLHAVFDPTDVSSAPAPARYWRTRPFYEQQDYLKQRIDKVLEALAKGVPDPDLTRQLNEWVANPFRPFAVARARTVAFQKNVVMKYLDLLVDWGDRLFRRDTIESINEATQLYILAAEILGPRPPVVTPRATPETHTFNTLAPQFAALTNQLTDIEVIVTSPRVDAVLTSPDSPPMPVPQLLYFCVPPNDKLLRYWDTVADRLFKIRNSLNLAGIRRTLPLFEPPIDPMLLVKAAAAGVDLSSAIADLSAPAPLYRFQILVQTAGQICQDVKALGSALLTALERRDSEQLAATQAQHEVAMLTRITNMKEDQIKEAQANISTLLAARDVSAERYRHYQTLLGSESTVPAEGTAPTDALVVPGATTLEKDGVRLIPQEENEQKNLASSRTEQEAASDEEHSASIAAAFPTLGVSVCPWGIGISLSYGGQNVAAIFQASANRKKSRAEQYSFDASKGARFASFILRAHNWKLEANLATREIARIDKDLAAARIRERMVTAERDDHLKQIEERQQVEEFLRTKYTNKELYDWMVGRISTVYFQAYQLAYDTARRTERAFRRELAVPDSDFIRFGYWDSLRKGLLAGEQLLHDVRRMEVAYLDQNAREYEITKHISLANIHPEGLLALKETGSCFVDLPEALFDLDHPGHYLRRIKRVSLTIPCVAGPYASVACKLTLLANRTRVDTRPTPQYAFSGPEDQRFELNSGGIRSIVTSTGREDEGLFETGSMDDRYLPFETAGAISSWRLELPADFPAFDYGTISDVVFHIRYTARDGGEPLRDAATRKLADALKLMEVERGKAGLIRGFSNRHEFPDAWQAFAYMPEGQAGDALLSMPIVAERFPAFAQGRTVKVTRVLVALLLSPEVEYDDADRLKVSLTPPTGGAQSLELKIQANRAGGLPAAEIALPAAVKVAAPAPGDPPPPPWKIEIEKLPENLAKTLTIEGAEVKRLDPEKVNDLVVLCAYIV